jgi:uncharacterized protein
MFANLHLVMSAVGCIHSVYRYPVKSMAGEAIESASLTCAGVEGDRLYAFESSGAPAGMLRVTGRERREMLCYRPTHLPDGKVEVLVPTGERFPVDSAGFLDYLEAHSEQANRFVLTRAQVPQTDVRPLSLISLQTVEHLSARLGQPLDPRRFRANLYLDLPGGPFLEDGLVGKTIRIGADVTIRVGERDPRCRLIAYDPEDPLGAEPLFSLMKLLDRGHEARCGVYATIRNPGSIRAGESLSLVEEEVNAEFIPACAEAANASGPRSPYNEI